MLFTFDTRAADLSEGTAAPLFALPDQHGVQHALSDYEGRWVVLYFYPKDDTPGCTREACEFRDDFQQFKRMGIEILGVSLDSADSHRKFARKYGLPFPLLVDEKGEVAAAYGARWKLGPLKFARRQSFIIDPQGRIARLYRSVDPATHSDEIIDALVSLGADRREEGN